MHKPLALEEQGWRALSSEREASVQFYRGVLRDDAVMLFPGGLIIEGKAAILNSLAAQPWASFRIEEPRVLPVSEQVSILLYRVSARREGSEPYVALVSSTYAHDEDEWKLVLHQQTPL